MRNLGAPSRYFVRETAAFASHPPLGNLDLGIPAKMYFPFLNGLPNETPFQTPCRPTHRPPRQKKRWTMPPKQAHPMMTTDATDLAKGLL
jgi:hypothetical protein